MYVFRSNACLVVGRLPKGGYHIGPKVLHSLRVWNICFKLVIIHFFPPSLKYLEGTLELGWGPTPLELRESHYSTISLFRRSRCKNPPGL